MKRTNYVLSNLINTFKCYQHFKRQSVLSKDLPHVTKGESCSFTKEDVVVVVVVGCKNFLYIHLYVLCTHVALDEALPVLPADRIRRV